MGKTRESAAQTVVLILGIACVALAVAKAPVWRDVVEEDRVAYQGPSDARRAARAVEAVANEVERYKQGQGSGLGGAAGTATTAVPFDVAGWLHAAVAGFSASLGLHI